MRRYCFVKPKNCASFFHMTDASIIGGPFPAREKTQADPIRLPAPDPVAAPVFIYDCVTPLGGETLLSLLMKRMMKGDQP